MITDEEYLLEFREPIQNFIRELKKNNKLQVLTEYSENVGMKSDARRKRPDREEETFQYYLPLLCRILGKFAYDNFYHKSDGYYEILFPGDSVHTYFYNTDYNHLAQTIERIFKPSMNTPGEKSRSIRKLAAYALYLWCEENGLSNLLKAAFHAAGGASSHPAVSIYHVFINQSSEMQQDTSQPDKHVCDLFLLPTHPERVSEHEYRTLLKKLLSPRTGWAIHSDSLKNLMAEEALNTCSIQEKLKKIAAMILEEAEKHPLYTYMIDRKHYDELRELLKLTASYHEKNNIITITVQPPICQLIQQISDWYNKKARIYTKYTLLEAAGKFAASAFGAEHQILKGEVLKSLSSQETAQLYNTIYRDLATGDFKWITGSKFSIRQYRLVFWGLGCALTYNRKRTLPEQIWEDIQNNFRRFIEPLLYSEHTNWRFDDIICFTTALMHRLDDSIKIPLIEMLCTKAYDFSVENRPYQELAIHILTYLLCEDQDLPHDLRTSVFLSTYGQTMYKIQHNEWDYINSSSTFYGDFARKSFLEACELIDGKYAKRQPNFFFLYGYLNPEISFEKKTLRNAEDDLQNADDFLKYAAYIQAQSWFQGNLCKEQFLRDHLKLLVEYSHKHFAEYLKRPLTDAPDKDILKYVYGSNLLCYAISNLCTDDSFSISCLGSNKQLLEILICTDFYGRYYNAAYNHAKYFENPPYYVLLCGSFRVICSRTFHTTKVITLDKEKLQIYERWFRDETGRYKILMMRLLSYTNFFTELEDTVKEKYLSELKTVLRETAFLPYDHIPDSPEGQAHFLEDPRLLF